MLKVICYCLLCVAIVTGGIYALHRHVAAVDLAANQGFISQLPKNCPPNDGSFAYYSCTYYSPGNFDIATSKCAKMGGSMGWYQCIYRSNGLHRPHFTFCVPIGPTDPWYACKMVNEPHILLHYNFDYEEVAAHELPLPWYASLGPDHHWKVTTTPCPAMSGTDKWYACKRVGTQWFLGSPLFKQPGLGKGPLPK